MNIETSRFGRIDIEDDKIITLPDGMLGFSGTRFILLTPEKPTPFRWLQSLDDPALAFVVVDAQQALPDYAVSLTSEEYARLALDEKTEVVVLLVVTLTGETGTITANLQGPVILNPNRMLAKQIVLEGNKFPTKFPLFGTASATETKAAGCAG